MKSTIDKLIEKGSIKVSDEIFFRTKAECASLFGRNYSHIIPGGIPHPKEKGSQLIFWQEKENEEWENGYTLNKKNEIIEFTERKKLGFDEWHKKRLMKNTGERENLIFYKSEGEGYKFRGVFFEYTDRSVPSGTVLYRRTSLEAQTYYPENNKPIRDLKGLLLAGRIENKEEVYLFYRNTKYTGRITAEGKIKTYLGEFSPSKAAVMLMSDNPHNERNKENANGYYQWKTWKGTPIGDLRNI
jgi:ribosomal protein S24E